MKKVTRKIYIVYQTILNPQKVDMRGKVQKITEKVMADNEK